jgi:hypothetical protein
MDEICGLKLTYATRISLEIPSYALSPKIQQTKIAVTKI